MASTYRAQINVYPNLVEESDFGISAPDGNTIILWQINNNVFSALQAGRTYMYAIRETGGIIPVATGFFDTPEGDTNYFKVDGVGDRIVIPTSEHGRALVTNVTVIDRENNIIIENNVEINTATQDVTVTFAMVTTYRIIIS